MNTVKNIVTPTPVPDYADTGVEISYAPAADAGYYMPAEWRCHERTLMQFPPVDHWGARQIAHAREEWVAVANTVIDYEPVTMAVDPRDLGVAKKCLSSQIELLEMPLDDGWSRDSGPVVLINGSEQRHVAGFSFNAWGEKFASWENDALAKAHFASELDFTLHLVDLVLEGGAVAIDGDGTLVTTEECLLNPNRNPGKSNADIETQLQQSLGVDKVIWIPKGLPPDPITDGHIDGMLAFVAPGVVLLHTTDDKRDPNYTITQTAKRILQENSDARGRQFEIIELPMTSLQVLHMNFYICNGAVLVPVAGKKTEDDAPLGVLREAFPSRRIVPVTGVEIAGGGGGIHCITQQVPAV